MQEPDRWQPGDSVTLRYLTRDGRPGMSWPFTVVRDSDELVALFIPANATYKRWAVDSEGRRSLCDATWRSDVLRLMFPGRGYSVWLFWKPDATGERRLAYYYINMEEPFRRSAIGFDTNDHMLDVVVEPDLSTWRWKDLEEFEARVTGGVYGGEFAAALRAEAEAAIGLVEARGSPFCDGWDSWLPEPDWAMPRLSEQWQTAAPVAWERAPWAYLDTTR